MHANHCRERQRDDGGKGERAELDGAAADRMHQRNSATAAAITARSNQHDSTAERRPRSMRLRETPAANRRHEAENQTAGRQQEDRWARKRPVEPGGDRQARRRENRSVGSKR
jgi:hypothetical protein